MEGYDLEEELADVPLKLECSKPSCAKDSPQEEQDDSFREHVPNLDSEFSLPVPATIQPSTSAVATTTSASRTDISESTGTCDDLTCSSAPSAPPVRAPCTVHVDPLLVASSSASSHPISDSESVASTMATPHGSAVFIATSDGVSSPYVYNEGANPPSIIDTLNRLSALQNAGEYVEEEEEEDSRASSGLANGSIQSFVGSELPVNDETDHELLKLKQLLTDLKLSDPDELLAKLLGLGVESVADLGYLVDEEFASLKAGLKPVPAKKLDKSLYPEIVKQREKAEQLEAAAMSGKSDDDVEGDDWEAAAASASIEASQNVKDGDTLARLHGSGVDASEETSGALADATTCMEAAYADSSICRYDLRTVERMLHILGKSLTRLNSKRHVLKGNKVVEERWDHMREVQQQQLKLLKLRKKQLARDNPEEAEAIAAEAEAEEEFESKEAGSLGGIAERGVAAADRPRVHFHTPEVEVKPDGKGDQADADLKRRRKEEMERLAKLERSVVNGSAGSFEGRANNNSWVCKVCMAINEDSTAKCRTCFTHDSRRAAYLHWH